MKLKGARAVVTGGAGLIGSHIADQLLHHEIDSVLCIDDLSRGNENNLQQAMSSGRVELRKGDILDRGFLAESFDGADVVFHQAAIRITQCDQEPRVAVEVLGLGTFNVLEAAVECGAEKVVAASSASIYGLADEFPTTEMHHSYNNRTLYGALKAFNEGMLRSFHHLHGLDYVALRYFNVYGPRMDRHGVYTEVLIRWIQRLRDGEPPIIYGDGSHTMDFVFAPDIARANCLAALASSTDRVYNIATGSEVSLLSLARELIDVMGADVEPIFVEERKANPVPRRLADTSQAARDLGFTAETDLRGGLKDLVAWFSAESAD